MASRAIISIGVTGKYVYVYKQGLYVNVGDRMQAVDTDNNGVYWFDTENANLDGASSYDVGFYADDPGVGDHTNVYNAQKKDEREYRYYGAKATITTLLAHKAQKTNADHEVTLTQAIAKDGNANANLIVGNLNTLVNGSDAGTLHSHSAAVSNEVIGTGDGTTVAFNFNLTKDPQVPGTIVITDTVETFSDNGNGTLTGDVGGSGSVNYSTGVGSVTFNTAPTNGQSITANYNYSKYTPEAHKDTHKEGGGDAFETEDLEATVSHISDAGAYFTGTNAESVLQEIGAILNASLGVPTGLLATHITRVGLFATITATWDEVSGAKYDLYVKNLTTNEENIFTFIGGLIYRFQVYSDATYQLKIRSRTVNGVSAWSTVVNHTIDDIGDIVDIVDTAQRVELAISPSGQVYSQVNVVFKQGDITLVNGNNNNITIGDATFLRIAGLTGVFDINGIAGGVAGRMIVLFNTTAQNMTISNEDAGSEAGNRILTMTGGDLTSTGTGNCTLVYDATASRWIVISWSA